MNNNEIEFEVKAVDGQGNFFDNSSSLIIKWSSTNNNLASFDSSIMTYADLDGDVIGSRTLKGPSIVSFSSGGFEKGLI